MWCVSARALPCSFRGGLSRTLPWEHKTGRCAQNPLQVLLACYTMGRRRTRISLGIGPAFLPAAGNCLATREEHLGIRVAAAPVASFGDVRARQPRRTGPSDAGGLANPREPPWG